MTSLGWCPSTHRLFRARDGLLARVKVPGGSLRVDQLRGLAMAAERTGNGTLEFTTRANVQLRGVRDDQVNEMQGLLAEVGLHDPSPAREDRRNVMAAPAAGLDATEVTDVRPYVARVLAALDALDIEDELTHKFGVLLDGGGTPSLGALSSDVALGAALDGDGAVVFRVALGHSLNDGTDFVVDPDDVGRLVEVVARHCASPPAPLHPGRAAALGVQMAPRSWRDVVDGRVATRDPGCVWARATTDLAGHPPRPLWRMWEGENELLRARDITAIADLLAQLDLAELRLTPWRAVLVGPLRAECEPPVVAGWTTPVRWA